MNASMDTFRVTNTLVTVHILAGKEPPGHVAVIVSRDDEIGPNYSRAKWIPFTKNVMVDLGEGDGKRLLWVAARWDYTNSKPSRLFHAQALFVTLDRTPPLNTHPPRLTEPLPGDFVSTTFGLTNSPRFRVDWPDDGTKICDDKFTIRGRLEDPPPATITGFVTDSEGQTRQVRGLVGRTGNYLLEDIPLPEGSTYVTLVSCDQANNSMITNLTVRRSHTRLVIDHVAAPPVPALIDVTGSIDQTNHTVWVNGVKAVTDPNGKWKAENVPMKAGGSAYISARAIPNDPNVPDEDADTNSPPPIVWGQTTNLIKAGFCFPVADTNQPNRYRCEVHVMNTTTTNMSFNWMRPKKQLQCSPRMLNSEGKEVAKREAGKQTDTALRSNINVHHITSDELGLIDGVLSLPANKPIQLTSLKLSEVFNLQTPGQYRLQIEPQLFQITSTGDLHPIALPALTASVTVIEQPSDLVYYLNNLFRQRKLFWGPSNDLQVALARDPNGQKSTGPREDFTVFVLNHSTNRLHNYVLPKPEEQFEVSLYDSTSTEVPKTALGRKQGQPLSLAGKTGVRRLRPSRRLFLLPNDADQCNRFNLFDHFQVSKPGKYHLTYQQRLYRVEPNGQLVGRPLPLVVVPIELR